MIRDILALCEHQPLKKQLADARAKAKARKHGSGGKGGTAIGIQAAQYTAFSYFEASAVE